MTTLSRRSLLAGAGAGLVLGGAAATSAQASVTSRPPRRHLGSASSLSGRKNPVPTTPTPPPGAVTLGLTRSAFSSSFTTMSIIDTAQTGRSGFQWYTRGPWGMPTNPTSDSSIRSDKDGTRYLRITPTVANCNAQLLTMDSSTGVGLHFGTGTYVEARIRFQPRDASTIDWSKPADWPAFWGASRSSMLGGLGQPVFGELDVMEALNGTSGYTATVHDWVTDYGPHSFSTNSGVTVPGLNLATWHTYAAAWIRAGAVGPDGRVSDRGRALFYLDGRLINEVSWGAGGPNPSTVYYDERDWSRVTPDNLNPRTQVTTRTSTDPSTFSSLDTDRMVLALGTGPTWPMDVQWVRAWTA